VAVHADFSIDGEDVVADCRLIGSRTLHGQSEPEVTTHFSGRVRLVAEQPQAGKDAKGPRLPDSGSKIDAAQVYRLYFHGPAYQVIDSAWRTGDQIIASFAKNLPANHEPSDLPTVVSPRLVELCFQTASLYGLAFQSRLGLPDAFRELKVLASPENVADRAFFAIVATNPDGSYDAKMVDEKGELYLVLHGYRTMDLPDPVPADLLEPLKKAFHV
jgi:hypothetical protein